MKCSRLTCLASLLALATALQLAAQDSQDLHHWHHHYKLINIGTFGGPQNYINGDDLLVPYIGSSQDVNNAGTLIGWADTSTLDPNPNFCFNADCYTSHAFQWRNGVRTDLGVLPGGSSSATSWVSANGLIAGASQNGEFDPLDSGYPEDRAVLWRNGKMIDLGTLPEGGYESGAQAVNSRGQVVGWALNTVPDSYSMALFSSVYNFYEPIYPYQSRAFLWQGGAMQDLGTLGTGTDAYAMAINERGQVVGISYTNSTPNQIPTSCSLNGALIPTQDPFLWENGKMIDLGTLGGTCGFPYWMNNQGQVVGQSDLAGDLNSHPFLSTTSKGMQDLGTLGGSSGSASMITNFGIVVGGTLLAGDNQIDAFLWDGRLHDLGALDGCSYAFAINDFGQVVGNWGGADCTEGAFLWENGGPMVDLNTLVHSNSGLAVQGAILISDLGEIVGSSVDVNGNSYAILLIPCDENHPGVEGCDYSLVDASVTAAAAPTPAAAPMPSLRPTRRLPSALRGTVPRGLQHASPQAALLAGDAHPSSTSTTDGNHQADFLSDSQLSPLHGRGYCLVDSKKELTGYCHAGTAWICWSGHSSACPAGDKALKPEKGGCGLGGSVTIDADRACSF